MSLGCLGELLRGVAPLGELFRGFYASRGDSGFKLTKGTLNLLRDSFEVNH